MEVNKIRISTVESRSNGILKVNISDLPFPPDFSHHHQTVVLIPPAQVGGNHKHPRREMFISLDEHLELHWMDEKGIKHVDKMREGNNLYLFDIQPNVPHAVINNSTAYPATLLEFADGEQQDVEAYIICQN